MSAIPVLDNLTPDDVQRFWSKVDKPYAAMDCWLWTDGLDKEGYARMWLWGHKAAAHRIAWALHHGEDPAPGLVIDHTCGTRMCVNPDHLEAVTQQENLRRAHVHQPCVAGHDAKHRTNGRCAQCYRERADRIRRAAKMLGITQTEYKQRYGWRRDTLENVLTTGQPQP